MYQVVKLTFFAGAHLNRLLRDESGTTAIEYTLIASGISIVIVAAVQAIGGSVLGLFDSVNAAFP